MHFQGIRGVFVVLLYLMREALRKWLHGVLI